MTCLTQGALALAAATLLSSGTPVAPTPGSSDRTPAGAEAADEYAAIGAVIDAYYDLQSGPAEQARDWDRFRSLFAPDARLTSTFVPEGTDVLRFSITTPDDFIENTGPRMVRLGFHQRQTDRKITIFQEIAHVLSAYESRFTPDGELMAQGVGSFQLMRADGRWSIVNVLWRNGGPELEIPERLGAAAEEPSLQIDRSRLNWSPDGEWLTFHAKVGESTQIFVIRTDGSGLRQLTQDEGGKMYPAFTADGQGIVYTGESTRADGTTDADIFTMRLDGSRNHVLFGRPGVNEREPQPLPDGRVGVMLLVPRVSSDVGVWDPATGDVTIVAGGPAVDVLGKWADDGTFVFTSNRDGRKAGNRAIYETFLANKDGSRIRNLGLYPADATGAGASSPDISRDGKVIVYASDKEGLRPFDFDHWIYDVETGTERKISRSPGAKVGVVSISPDSRSIVYAVDYDGDGVHQIAILSLDTFEVTHLRVAHGAPR